MKTEFIWFAMLIVWGLALTFHVWGAWLARRQFESEANRDHENLKPVSILKPVKGVDGGLEENLESFFELRYPSFELLFSVADADDPAIPIIRKVMARFPKVDSQLFIGDVEVGLNPKVNNLVRSFDAAKNDWVLISDCNVRVREDYLYCTTEKFAPDVGIVTASVTGSLPSGLGSWVEALFLNTFYRRWMLISKQVGHAVVLGKSMLFRKSDAAKFGGLKTLGRYLAEDYVAGLEMGQLGLKIEMMSMPVQQPLHHKSLKSFWGRHVRWGRIRKSQAPGLFLIEPLLSLWISGLMGALAMKALFGIAPAAVFVAHVFAWIIADLMLVRAGRAELSWKTPLMWFAKELLYLPLWVHIGSGRTVMWRGQKLVVKHGGLLDR